MISEIFFFVEITFSHKKCDARHLEKCHNTYLENVTEDLLI